MVVRRTGEHVTFSVNTVDHPSGWMVTVRQVPGTLVKRAIQLESEVAALAVAERLIMEFVVGGYELDFGDVTTANAPSRDEQGVRSWDSTFEHVFASVRYVST